MKTNGSAYVVIAGAVIMGYLGYQLWFNPARAVKRRLGEVAAALSIPANDTALGRVTRLARLRRYLAGDLRVRDEVTGRDLTSRDDVLAIVAKWTPPPPGVWDVAFVDVQITVDSATEARSLLTVEVADHDRLTGDQPIDTRDAAVTLSKRDSEWVITTVEAKANLSTPARR